MRLLVVFLPLAAIAAELPVREVILYKHGVAFYRRAGDLAAGESARLDFQASEMNDVLKSLTVVDRTGAPVAGLRYDSSEPLDRKLAGFSFKLDGQPSLAALLEQMKGARLELKLAGGDLAGIVVSGRITTGGRDRPDIEQVVLLTDAGELRTVDLSAAVALRFADARLQEQLKEYLTVLHGSRSRDKRSVVIEPGGSAARRLSVSYLSPAATWKSSYRLLFTDEGASLEGWAIVDNTTDEEWSQVRLALVSGRPVSFISPLYEPRYRRRPVSEIGDDGPAAPVIHAGAVQERLADALGGYRRQNGRGQNAQMQNMGNINAREEAAAPPPPAVRGGSSTVAAATDSQEIGELFEYRFTQPVTVKRNGSAMLPFLQQKIAARKLLIYSESMGRNPMNAAEVTNSSGKTLDGGPITVFEQGAYAGEALVETLKTGDRRLVSYAVDLGARVATAFGTGRQLVREIHFRRGVLTTRTAMEETKTFTIRNVDAKEKTLVIEHPKRPEYELVAMKPTSTTATAYRFEVPLKPETTGKFVVSEERIVEQATALTNLTPDVLTSYVSNKVLSAEGRRQLAEVIKQKQKAAAATRALEQTEQELRAAEQDQSRVRQNISTLNSVGQREAVQKYANELVALETKLVGLRDQASVQRRDKSTAEADLAAMIEKMEF
ncbi:MAG: DUF4139 domain-containing protein [Bryobacteraceae bacterium]